MKVNDLLVMQESLRNEFQLSKMVEFVCEGGFWTKDVLENFANLNKIRTSPLMEIVQFPDGRHMIHDGHHRIVSIFLGGRDFVRRDEYVLKQWDYTDYLKISFENKWVTPFDPITELRLPDIYDFKHKALNIAKNNEEEAVEFISANKHLYAKIRTISNVLGLSKTVKGLLDVRNCERQI